MTSSAVYLSLRHGCAVTPPSSEGGVPYGGRGVCRARNMFYICQILSAYSRTARSAANTPDSAMFTRLIRAEAMGSAMSL